MQTQTGRLFTMETTNLEQMVIRPLITEVKTTIGSFNPSTTLITDSMPFKIVVKSAYEQNNDKKSMYLVLVPSLMQIGNKSTPVLESLDFTPLPPRSIVAEHASEVLEVSKVDFLTNPLLFVQQIVSKEKIELASKLGEEDENKGSPRWLNTLMGIAAFFLVGYLAKILRPQQTGKGAKGGGPGLFGKGGKFSNAKKPGFGSAGRRK
jgi:hypothetical protein